MTDTHNDVQERLERIEAQQERILRHIRISTITNIVRLLIVVVPLVLALIYLPPLINNVVEQYTAVLDIDPGEFNASQLQELLNAR